MPRAGTTYVASAANVHTQVTRTGTADVKTVTLENTCSAIMVSGRTTSGFLTFDGSTPSVTNGLEISAGAQPILLPIGRYAHSAHTLKWASSAAANAILNVLQMS